MASFRNAWHYLPSADAAGFVAFSISLIAAGLLQAAARGASAHSELAALQGNDALQHSSQALLTGAASPAGTPATDLTGRVA